MLPLGLYIHIPWCVRKCPYCDFNSHRLQANTSFDDYLAALIVDWHSQQQYWHKRTLHSVFIGGGTPSLLSGEHITQLLETLRRSDVLTEQTEITLEANPGTVDEQHFYDYRRAGVNRLSIGGQSFQSSLLKKLGRIHSPQQIQQAVATARLVGFTNINLDLMFALPGQTLAQAAEDLNNALALALPHISYYQLTLEPETPFYHRPPQQMPDDKLAWQMQKQAQTLLHQAGFSQYEISAWSQPGWQCAHNTLYWQYGDYLAIGAGGHGKITQNGKIYRYQHPKGPTQYQKVQQEKTSLDRHSVPPKQQLVEFMMNALRLRGGVPMSWVEERGGVIWEQWQPNRQQAIQQGLLKPTPHWLQTTEQGQRYLDSLLMLMMD